MSAALASSPEGKLRDPNIVDIPRIISETPAAKSPSIKTVVETLRICSVFHAGRQAVLRPWSLSGGRTGRTSGEECWGGEVRERRRVDISAHPCSPAALSGNGRSNAVHGVSSLFRIAQVAMEK